jgi:hypothetical protein
MAVKEEFFIHSVDIDIEDDEYEYEEVETKKEEAPAKKPFLQDLLARNFNFFRSKGGSTKKRLRERLKYIEHKRTAKISRY